ncbi:uncharacterized protein C8A04DRAFT_31670 [Dichotomopilus funicola]|uniref:Uncharacterized protein n=1 Tax=Dichotomopilus funicola TaxID=1934379 RepID=A0AAN6ZKD7_9PEZI|nr:hypothetical protein C8A04DRAFT_31670 [Dichotomopilus funicola]
MAEPKTVLNGDQPESNTLRHLLTIPAVQDSVRVFSSHPVGKVSIQLTSSAYQYVGAPVLNLFSKPLAYVAPYAKRADDFGVQTLAKVEEKYPVVKKSSPELYQDARDAALAPVKHVSEVYQGAYQRTGGNHTIASGKAAAKTAVVVSLEGGIYVVREALRLGESFRVIKSIQGLVDQLEEAVKRQNGDAEAGPAGPAVVVNGPRDGADPKEVSV